MPYANREKAGWAASWVGKEGPARTCKCWEILRLLPGKSKSTLYLYRSIRYCRSDMHPCPSLHFFFLFNIYSKVLCDVGALRYTTFLYSHNPAYRCLSRVPECVFACGRINVWLLMIVDTRDTVPYHSSCTMGCSWSQPTTLKASILIWNRDVLSRTSLEGHRL